MPRYRPPLRRKSAKATGFKKLQAEFFRCREVHGPRSKATENAWRALVSHQTNSLKQELSR